VRQIHHTPFRLPPYFIAYALHVYAFCKVVRQIHHAPFRLPPHFIAYALHLYAFCKVVWQIHHAPFRLPPYFIAYALHVYAFCKVVRQIHHAPFRLPPYFIAYCVHTPCIFTHLQSVIFVEKIYLIILIQKNDSNTKCYVVQNYIKCVTSASLLVPVPASVPLALASVPKDSQSRHAGARRREDLNRRQPVQVAGPRGSRGRPCPP
jgi:hypothetical protein